jgi:serine-type D-Ala-D-Ala carboxypeptidase/endopeptidase (penicillin-binding protein 4)
VNFNTISAVRDGDKVRSAEKRTPITPLAIAQFRAQGPNGNCPISLSQDPAVSLQYAGELIAAIATPDGPSGMAGRQALNKDRCTYLNPR